MIAHGPVAVVPVHASPMRPAIARIVTQGLAAMAFIGPPTLEMIARRQKFKSVSCRHLSKLDLVEFQELFVRQHEPTSRLLTRPSSLFRDFRAFVLSHKARRRHYLSPSCICFYQQPLVTAVPVGTRA
ncbi:MAG: hypothetical protein J2P48_03010 [Alphaproteobacteria bacterium]|nr:hypothetical protein [Alphaproteobacteria bacterium]